MITILSLGAPCKMSMTMYNVSTNQGTILICSILMGKRVKNCSLGNYQQYGPLQILSKTIWTQILSKDKGHQEGAGHERERENPKK